MEGNHSQRLHVAVLDEELPFPLTSGKRIRTYNLLSRLAERQRITYLCHANPDPVEQTAAERAFDDLGIRTIVVDRRIPRKSGLGFYARLAGNLFSSKPYSVASHFSQELNAAVEQLSIEDPPDLWHVEWTPYAEYFRSPPDDKPWVVMAHNVESLIWQRYAEAERHPLKRWYIRRQHAKFERFERWAYQACSRAIAVSDEDARLIRNRFAASRVDVVDNGVDPAYFTPDSRIARDPFRILFLGSLDWRPNLDGIQLLLGEIFPRIRAAEPRATLQIVGRKPSETLQQQIASMQGVEIHADVPDVRPFLARAGMLAVPLRIGGGSRLKILEALAAEVPVVTTRVGVEGLHLESGQHVTVADAPSELARSMVQLMNTPTDAKAQAVRGRRAVLARYDWDTLADQLVDLWKRSSFSRLQNDRVTCLV